MNLRVFCCFALMSALAWGQAPDSIPEPAKPDEMADRRLPNGKSQAMAILKADQEKSLRDAADLVQLSSEFQEELQKNGPHILSISALKKLDEMEKRIRSIRGRMKRN